MKSRFVNKTVVVTGASSGIGAEAARQFAAEGARVVLAARGREALEATARSIDSDKTLVVPVDVTNTTAAADLLKQAQARFGSIDIVVNNAGTHARGAIEDRDVEELLGMVNLNLGAPVVLSRLAIPYLRSSGGGAIVNVGSTAGLIPIAGAATYSATKAGLRAFSTALREELRDSGIMVSVILPGLVDTGSFSSQIDRVPPMVFSQVISEPAAVAKLILDCAHDGRAERVIPRFATVLPTITHVFPGLKPMVWPLLTRIGRRARERYLRNRIQKVAHRTLPR